MIKGECKRKEKGKEKEYSLVQRSGKGYLHARKPRKEKNTFFECSSLWCCCKSALVWNTFLQLLQGFLNFSWVKELWFWRSVMELKTLPSQCTQYACIMLLWVIISSNVVNLELHGRDGRHFLFVAWWRWLILTDTGFYAEKEISEMER